MTSETDAFQQFMFCREFSSLESIQNALQNILGINHGGLYTYIYIYIYIYIHIHIYIYVSIDYAIDPATASLSYKPT